MILKLQNIKRLIDSVTNNNISQISIKSNQIKILINKSKKKQNTYKKNNFNHILNNNSKTGKIINNAYLSKVSIKDKTKQKPIKTQKNKADNTKNCLTINSPMLGTFYRSPAPNEPPFIEKNDIVNKRQTVCIIEAMKLMNEIESEFNGEIIDILVKDGDIVDCGQALMKIKKYN
uniref:Biotin carboxyl carrier protein of acetyl-CoA carboxylase n=1 Tax=Cliftonaea pectinata TaxID=2007206 RepID=A0A1Z1MQD4_9FLOR|nr:acetyl-CoA carboxylase biotin carboxyl carrier protein [Cliftonaea pectinata]ARW68079.1 acetyl-CoA carboxylase biotin carboxyl carrier protein [Cliftonaea pectinata]